MDNLPAIAAIIGFVNGCRLFQTDRAGFAYFLIALIAGLLAGWMHLFGLTVEMGLLAGLASSGLYRVGQKVGGQ